MALPGQEKGEYAWLVDDILMFGGPVQPYLEKARGSVYMAVKLF